ARGGAVAESAGASVPRRLRQVTGNGNQLLPAIRTRFAVCCTTGTRTNGGGGVLSNAKRICTDASPAIPRKNRMIRGAPPAVQCVPLRRAPATSTLFVPAESAASSFG